MNIVIVFFNIIIHFVSSFYTVELAASWLVYGRAKLSFSLSYHKNIKLSNSVSPSFVLSTVNVIVALSKLDSLSIENGSPTRPTTFEHRTSLFIMLSTVVVFSIFPVAVNEILTFVIGCSLLSGTTSIVCLFFSLLSIMPFPSVSCLFGSQLNLNSSSSVSLLVAYVRTVQRLGGRI